MKNSWFVIFSLFSFLIVGCQNSQRPHEEGASSKSKVVNLAIMPNYIASETLAEFEKQTGIKVNVSHFSSGEELLAKLQAGLTTYDLALSADYLVYVFVKLGLLEELDKSKVQAFSSINPKYLNPSYDPQNRYSIPYDFGTTGIAVNAKLCTKKIQSWKDLMTAPELAGRFSLLDDIREVIGSSLKSLGYSLNSTNPEALNMAKQLLVKTRTRVKSFTSEPIMPLVNREIIAAQAFMTDALQARKLSQGEIEYIFPQEGGTLWIDNFMIPKSAHHKAEAYKLLNFLLEPKVNRDTATNFFFAPLNQATVALLPKAVRADPAIFPSEAILKRYEMIEDLGDALLLWDRTWTEIKIN